jgi:hypothetical protein
MRYDLGFYIAEDGIHHCHRLENLKSYKGRRHPGNSSITPNKAAQLPALLFRTPEVLD